MQKSPLLTSVASECGLPICRHYSLKRNMRGRNMKGWSRTGNRTYCIHCNVTGHRKPGMTPLR